MGGKTPEGPLVLTRDKTINALRRQGRNRIPWRREGEKKTLPIPGFTALRLANKFIRQELATLLVRDIFYLNPSIHHVRQSADSQMVRSSLEISTIHVFGSNILNVPEPYVP